MENTVENNKEGFFALYSAPLKKNQLELKSLKGITKRDAELACYLGYPKAFTNPVKEWSLQKFPNGDSLLSSRESKFSFWICPEDFPVLEMHENIAKTEELFSIDDACYILRSEGYALPFFGTTVIELEELGWLRLKS